MVALRVKLNGKHLCVAGGDDLAVLNTIVGAVGNLGPKTKKHRDEPPDIYLRVGGLTGRTEGEDEHLNWTEAQTLTAGDKIEIEVLETSDVDAPVKCAPLDVERQKQRERERYEAAKETYLTLRSKFEPE